MNILILNWRDPKNPLAGGAEIVTLEHAKAWIKKGHSVTWYTAKFRGSKNEEDIDGIKITRHGNFFTVYIFAPFFYLLNRNEFDFVIDEFHGVPYLTPLYVRKPKIAFIHEVAGEIWDYMYPFPINKIGKKLEKIFYILYRNNIKIWTDADSTIDDLESYGVRRENCIAINCPINNKTLSKLPIKEKNPTFIFVSRVVRMKGLENVIKAFSRIQKELPKANLWIAGGGDEAYIKEMEDLIRSYSIQNKVKFFGRVTNDKKLELMRKAHILLLGITVHGGWGLVLIEAASQATPSIVYDVSGLKDAVIDGKTGVVLKENSPEEMAKQSIELFEDKNRYKRFQINGLDRSRNITWDKATKQSMNLIEITIRESAGKS